MMQAYDVEITLTARIRKNAVNEEDAKLIAKFVPIQDWQWIAYKYEAKPVEDNKAAVAEDIATFDIT